MVLFILLIAGAVVLFTGRGKLSRLLGATGAGLILLAVATAEKEAEANRVLAQSIANDPNVVVGNCIKQVAAAEAGRFPAGFQCWPGASGSVVVPSR